MRVIHAALAGLALTLINLGAIMFGFAIYTLVRPADQIAVQAPTAAAASILATLVFLWLLRRFAPGGVAQSSRSAFRVYMATLLWTPVIFVPLHLATQGYLTSFGNIAAAWLFQLPVNALALWLDHLLLRRPAPAGRA